MPSGRDYVPTQLWIVGQANLGGEYLQKTEDFRFSNKFSFNFHDIFLRIDINSQ